MKPGDKGELLSQWLPESSGTSCLQFWFNIEKAGAGHLAVVHSLTVSR